MIQNFFRLHCHPQCFSIDENIVKTQNTSSSFSSQSATTSKMSSSSLNNTNHQNEDSSSSSSLLIEEKNSYKAFSEMLLFLINMQQAKGNNSNSLMMTLSSNRRRWYECVVTKNVEPSFLESGLAVCYVTASNVFNNIIENENSKTTSSAYSGAGRLFAIVIVEEAKEPSLDVVTIIIDEDFAFKAASHCDSLFKQHLAHQRKEAERKTNRNDNQEDTTTKQQQQQQRNHLEALLATRLFFSPNNYQAWNLRKEILLEKIISKKYGLEPKNKDTTSHQLLIISSELEFNALMLARVPKSPETWYHRIWIIQTFVLGKEESKLVVTHNNNDNFLLDFVNKESAVFAKKACAIYRRCYPSWEFRRVIWFEVLEKFSSSSSSSSDQTDENNEENNLLKKIFVDGELRATLKWFEQNPGDASAVSYFSSLFLKAILLLSSSSSSLNNKSDLEMVLDEAWIQSQRMIRSSCQLQKLDSEGKNFSIPQLSHESIWMLRRVVVELSRRLLVVVLPTKNANTNANTTTQHRTLVCFLHRGWTVQNELEFVSTIVESFELAEKIHHLIHQNVVEGENSNSDAIVMKLPLNQKDYASIDQGDFAPMFALKYGTWLLRECSV